MAHRYSTLLLIAALTPSFACTLWQREPTYYAEVLTELFESRTEAIDACYDRYLEEVDDKAAGKLVLALEVAPKTGVLTKVEPVAEQSDVPEGLAACVIDNVSDLKVDPPDVNTAEASFTWEFTPKSRKKTPADPFALAQKTLLSCYSAHLAEVDRDATGVLVVDYTLSRETGALERFEIVAGETTAPAQVVECAKPTFEAAKLEPDQVDDRNAAAKRSFNLRFTPYAG